MNKKNVIVVGLGALATTIAALLLLQKKKDDVHMKPPKGAPQLDINHAGSQTDFPTPPVESEIG